MILRKKLTAFIISAIFTTFIATSVQALEVENSGNGSNSQNQVSIQDNSSVTVQQGNDAQLKNNVDSSANTGGSNLSGNTGDAVSEVYLKNNLNKNSADVECCDGKKIPTPTPTPSGKPTPTPTPGNGGGNGGNGGNGGVGGGGTTSGNNPQIIGLSKTSGENNLQYAFYLAGLVCLGLGGKFLLKR